jgi:hypothetical protein
MNNKREVKIPESEWQCSIADKRDIVEKIESVLEKYRRYGYENFSSEVSYEFFRELVHSVAVKYIGVLAFDSFRPKSDTRPYDDYLEINGVLFYVPNKEYKEYLRLKAIYER